MSAEPCRLLILGAGGVATRHALAAEALGVPVSGVCDVRPEAAAALAARTGAEAYVDPATALESTDATAVIVTTPHSSHAPLTIAAAGKGLHVLVEKPMATTSPDCAAMIEAARVAGRVLAVGHVLHYVPALVRARELLAAGAIGRPFLVVARRAGRYEPGSRPDWFFRPELAGGGIAMNLGAHQVDTALWLLDARATRVTGFTRTPPGLRVETDAAALIELDGGARVSLALTGTGTPGRNETEVIGEDGALRLTGTGDLRISRHGEESPVELAGPAAFPPGGSRGGVSGGVDDAFTVQLAAFVAAIRGESGAAPIVSGAHGAAVIDVISSLYASADRGLPVDIPVREFS